MGTLTTVVPQNASLLWRPWGTFDVLLSHTKTHTNTGTERKMYSFDSVHQWNHTYAFKLYLCQKRVCNTVKHLP